MTKRTRLHPHKNEITYIEQALRKARANLTDAGKEHDYIAHALEQLTTIKAHILECHRIIGYGTYQQGKADGYKLARDKYKLVEPKVTQNKGD